MKGIAKSSAYFSAYPLRAVEKTTPSSKENQPSQSPYLRSLLTGRTRSTGRARVYPMVNPYRDPYKEKKSVPQGRIAPITEVPENIELLENRWFNNYE